jgi:hypothetical protein
MAAFARQQGLSYCRLCYWLQRSHRTATARPQFQNVPLGSLLTSAWAAEVVGTNGLTVRLSAQVPPALAMQLVGLTCRL